MTDTPSYHDLYITTPTIERTAIFNLPFNIHVTCCRVAGWEVWDMAGGMRGAEKLIAGEYDTNGLRLDVAGHVICDSLAPRDNEDHEN